VPASQDFKDHFSEQSADYARHRPRYPEDLFAFLAGLTARHALAWDCATGNGQAAIALSAHFERVIATDASAAQIDAALAHPGVSYRVAPAEASGLDAHSIDLITVGQALHWFDHARFFAEARRVAAPGGILAAWCYELCEVSAACDAVVATLYADIVGAYWPPERRLIEARYADIAMPGTPLEPPRFAMHLDWTVADMLGYLRTWSACKRYRADRGDDPVAHIEADLRAAWGAARRPVSWPLTVRVVQL